MINREKGKLNDIEIRRVMNHFFRACDEIRDCLNYFDESTKEENKAKEEMLVNVTSLEIRATALLCTLSVTSSNDS